LPKAVRSRTGRARALRRCRRSGRRIWDCELCDCELGDPASAPLRSTGTRVLRMLDQAAWHDQQDQHDRIQLRLTLRLA
jgi:ribosomal protein L37AE/L43A